MNIGEASKQSAVSAKMIRHYEEPGAAAQGARAARRATASTTRRRCTRCASSGARATLASGCGEIEVAARPVAQPPPQQQADVKRVALEHATDLQRRIDEMRAMQRTLQHLAHCCHGDERPDCPILDDLAGGRAE